MADNNKDTTFVFRLQSETNGQHDLRNTLKHWDESCMYDDKQIATIESSNKESFNQPTSIPSPFARIALVKTAFAEVAEYGESALKAYQKIVSDSLDVAEIFFTFDKWRDKIEIIRWGKVEDLKKLEVGHKQIQKTLNTFLVNDAATFNFDKMEYIYILKYKNTGEMIGATSPCTLFFSSANDLTDVEIPLNNNHNAFDGKIVPLSERSWEFKKYLYTWINANNENCIIEGRAASSRFSEFQKYLEQQKPLIGRTEEIDALAVNTDSILNSSFKVLRAPDVEVLGKSLYQNNEATAQYLTADDLLEDSIIRLPYEIKKDSFFDGNLQENSKEMFLLPIKEKFFDFYSIDDLKRNIKINHSGNVVEVELQTNGTKFKKEYKKSSGNVIDLNFDCAIFPNVKFEQDEQAYYRFGLACNFKEKDKYNVDFIKINSAIDNSKKRFSVRNETHINNYQLKNYSLNGSNFDYVRINYDGINGLVFPYLELKTGEKEFTFAIDFGTTNTHIEYKIGNSNNIVAFNISKEQIDEKQVHWLHGGDDYLKEVFDEEFIPAYTDEEFRFPMRSALSYGEKTNWQDVYPFEKASADELYEKRVGYDYDHTITDLKWSDNGNNQKQVKVYIESLMYLLRNKVVIGNGRLEQTKIRWFYPVSMERGRYNNLKEAWNSAYEKYFGGDNNNIIPITESVAPFEYYIRDRDANNLVTIDIGGGTTDMVISANGQVDLITSFRFAANTIFGDGYTETMRIKNGIVRQFLNVIKDDLKSEFDENSRLLFLFNEMCTNKTSTDIASFLFSLKQNKEVRRVGGNLAENANLEKKLITDTTQKITFIFFYSAIIYHLAQLMKAEKLQMPDKIVFSGNGSRVISFFTDDSETLRDYTKLIFEKIHGSSNFSSSLDIILNKENPKEATCKGGFFVDKAESFGDIYKKKVVLHSNGTNTVFKRNDDDINELNTYKAVDEAYISKTVDEAKNFINFVLDLLPFFSNRGYKLNQTSIEIAKKVCFNKLDIYAKNGWQLKKKEITDAEGLEETLFFYPLVGMLKELSDAICNENLKSNK
ncbi:hypothetical protein [Bacteroides sp. 224]|uniref:hypothetical protein n=1 Tax=Bacteroides sp. 224 TaxID=2302936 RepID=UPI0013D0A2A3|nr:hypothetical protein [Bacteroides sp. 224]NDV65648.1 hypothetical protein [Bacteroides sp. 224]